LSTNPYESPQVADSARAGTDPNRLTLFGATMYVLLTSGGGALVGGLTGLLIGVAAPDYYRTVFRHFDSPGFNPAIWGMVLGGTQGIFAGAGIGFVILIIYVWYLTRAKAAK
jgi:hypothetical protein